MESNPRPVRVVAMGVAASGKTTAGSVQFVFLAIGRGLVQERMAARKGHFITAQMVESQFATLEVPGTDEPDIITIDARLSVEEVSLHG